MLRRNPDAFLDAVYKILLCLYEQDIVAEEVILPWRNDDEQYVRESSAGGTFVKRRCNLFLVLYYSSLSSLRKLYKWRSQRLYCEECIDRTCKSSV